VAQVAQQSGFGAAQPRLSIEVDTNNTREFV